MARVLYDKKLVLDCNLGKDDKGKDIIKKLRFGDVNLNATNEKMYEVAQAMGALTVKMDTVYVEEKNSL